MEKQGNMRTTITDVEAVRARNRELLHAEKRRKLMELYAHRSEGYIYVVIRQENEEKFDICGCFSDSDQAYFEGMKLKQPFKIEKHRVMEEDDVWEEEKGSAVVAALRFDEFGRLLDFHSREEKRTGIRSAINTRKVQGNLQG